MDARGIRRSRAAEEEESYFVSMADMMVGLLFIFLILLLYFALQFKQTTATLTGANEDRTKLLTTLEQSLKAKGLRVTVDYETGVLRLPEDVLFATGEYRLSPAGLGAITTVSGELARVLPCYSDAGKSGLTCKGTAAKHKLDAIFIEGHTDNVPYSGAPPVSTNLELSALRATETFKALMIAQPGLRDLTSPVGTRNLPIFGVSGYGESRPADLGDSDEARSHNRRIDLRFLMITPKSEGAAGLLGAIGGQ